MHAARVFLDYDQEQLDACYDQTVWAPNIAQIHRRQNALSTLARERLAPAQRFAYGPGSMEHLDLYHTTRPNAPIFMFVHGGAWKENSSERFAFAAEAFVAAGTHFVLVDFNGVENTAMRSSIKSGAPLLGSTRTLRRSAVTARVSISAATRRARTSPGAS
jgi:acetyl esterase/lipase